VKELMANEEIKVMPHPPYSPDLNAIEKSLVLAER